MEQRDSTPEAVTVETPQISLRSVAKAYPGTGAPPVVAVDDVDLDIGRGEFVTITGRSGSGKTTLLNLMAGLTAPSVGSVAVHGCDLWSMTDRERSRMRNERLGFVFQFPSLVPSLTALENVTLPTALWPAGAGVPARGMGALELLELVGLADRAGAWPRQLSAGQQQRVVLARALVRHPDILLADEPSSNLDEATELEMMQILRTVHEATAVTIVIVTHTSALVSWGTRSIRMADGRLVEDSGAHSRFE
jgi:ABC-type lipoprotein export system ATPase subunit